MLRKNPVFTVTAAATIALGIGASTAMFTVTNAVLLRPLPYRNADRLALVYRDFKRTGRFQARPGWCGIGRRRIDVQCERW